MSEVVKVTSSQAGGGFFSDLYNALVCDMKKLVFPSQYSTNMEYYLSTSCQPMIETQPGKPPII